MECDSIKDKRFPRKLIHSGKADGCDGSLETRIEAHNVVGVARGRARSSAASGASAFLDRRGTPMLVSRILVSPGAHCLPGGGTPEVPPSSWESHGNVVRAL